MPSKREKDLWAHGVVLSFDLSTKELKNYFSRKAPGFTLVEMIVVIAVIGILAAVSVPWLLSSGNNAVTANEYARGVYYAAQSVFTDMKLSADKALYGSTAKCIITFEVSESGELDSTSLTVETAPTMLPTELADLSGKLLEELGDYFRTADRSGWFRLEADGGFRIVAAYWSGVDITTLTEAFSGNTVGGVTAGAFPAEKRADGAYISTL